MNDLIVTVSLLLGTIAIWSHTTALHDHYIEHLDRQTNHLEGIIAMSTQDTVNAIVAQLGKAKDEILTALADVQAQLEAANAASSVDLSALTAAAQALDDVVPDAPSA